MRVVKSGLMGLESSLLFFPQYQLRGTPMHVGLDYEDVWLTADDGVRVHAWFMRGGVDGAGGRGAMLMTHGNGGNISVRLDQYAEIVRRFGGMDILSLSYRGYGLSEGEPSESGFALDAEAAYGWLASRLGRDGGGVIVLFGRSLGGAVAARLASCRDVDGLILECAPSSIGYVARRGLPWRFLPLERVMVNRFDTASYVKSVDCPVLVIHSEDDEVVPYECGGIIYDAVRSGKRFHSIPGARHNYADTVDPEGYYGALEAFLSDFGIWGGSS